MLTKKIPIKTKKISIQKIDTPLYRCPKEKMFMPNREAYERCSPTGSQWVHDEQTDDVLTEIEKKKACILDDLKKIEIPEQRTDGWFKMRESKITASDGGTALDKNKYEQQYSVILKKITKVPFSGKKACYHGKKFEHIATMIYQYRMNVSMSDFGLIGHPIHKFLGASPDGIVDKFKLDGIHKTKYVGRMLEIKVPETRSINMSSDEIFDVCPEHYWIQVQLQLECCNLDECDFWQCTINEYGTRDDFIADTDISEPFRSISTGYEKGCLIQLLPINVINNDFSNFYDILYDNTLFIYPPRIEMTPYDCDMWIATTLANYKNDAKYKNYAVDRVIYWKLMKSRCLLVERDKKWFAEQLPKFVQLWEHITFLRSHPNQKQLVLDYINYANESMRAKYVNNTIMNTIKIICNTNNKKYDEDISAIEEEIKHHNIAKEHNIIKCVFEYIDHISTTSETIKDNKLICEAVDILKDPLNRKYKDKLDQLSKYNANFHKETVSTMDEGFEICE